MLNKSVSYDFLLLVGLIAIPLLVFMQLPNDSNPYMNGSTPWVVSLISVFVILAVKLNQRLKIPLLDVLILVYLLFWHLRFLTLAVFPKYDLVLTRTVEINAEAFNAYAWVVLGTFVSAVLGFYLAYRYIAFHKKKYGGKSIFKLQGMSKGVDISDKFSLVTGYFILMVAFHVVVITFFGFDEKPRWLGYLSLLFSPDIAICIMLLLLFSPELKVKSKAVIYGLFLLFVMAMMVSGSRSALVNLVLSTFVMLLVLRKKPSFNYKGILLIALAGLFMLLMFAYATFQRDLKQSEGMYSVSSMKYAGCKVIGAVTGESSSGCQDLYESFLAPPAEELKSSMGGLFGYALARAGYLDFSAEFYVNDNFDEILTLNNIGKSIVNNSVPGDWFEDGRRIEHRIRDVYSPGAVGYQSDAIGVVGENYRLFGVFYPFAVSAVTFAFACLFLMCKPSVVGLYTQYVLAMGVVYWWNSFGYDTLLLDMSRKLILGIIVLNLIFFDWSKVKKYVR